MKATFEINHRGDNFYMLSTLERKGDRLLVSSSIKMEGKKEMKLKADFELAFIQGQFNHGLKKMGYSASKGNSFIFFPISEDCEWKTMLFPEIQESLFQFLDITYRK